jgi:hypothetical protein
MPSMTLSLREMAKACGGRGPMSPAEPLSVSPLSGILREFMVIFSAS